MRPSVRCSACKSHPVSIHAPWEGCDRCNSAPALLRACFNSRTLGRVRLQSEPRDTSANAFQFTHPGKGATIYYDFYRRQDYVSIHAPWEGCDVLGYFGQKSANAVSIHAPWEGCDRTVENLYPTCMVFQFTHPGKGATTPSRSSTPPTTRFQFTHPGKGATRRWRGGRLALTFQFTHPGKGATSSSRVRPLAPPCFNSRTLGRVRHPARHALRRRVHVSIHAPWEGCDFMRTTSPASSSVSIHAPWEGCDNFVEVNCRQLIEFQFTHPGKGATIASMGGIYPPLVSIHAPWEGCDVCRWLGCNPKPRFNSRTLGRVRQEYSSLHTPR